MSVQLYLLPFDCDQGDFAYAHTLLNCQTDTTLWEEIEALPQQPVPDDFTSFVGHSETYDDTCYGNTTITPYGTWVRWVQAGALTALSGHSGVQAQARNRAIWAYLGCLPPWTKVALYWH